MKTKTLDKITVSTPDHIKPKASVIWLHGLGADGYDFEPIVPQLNLPEALGVRFVFPHAPMRPVTLNAGMEMRAWFDLYGLGSDHDHDKEGLANAYQQIVMLIEHEVALGVPHNQIILAGFSQGGALALYTALTYPKELAAVAGLSTYLPVDELDALEVSPDKFKMPVFVGHGVMDPVINIELGKASKESLMKLGFDVSWHTYPMAHSVCGEEISDVSDWMKKVFVS